MNTSTEIGELFGALAAAKLQYKPLVKSKDNPFFKSKYADLSDVIEATDAALSANGLAVVQGADVKDGRAIIHTILGHKSGQWVSSTLSLKIDKDTAQGAGAAMTYGQRYSWQAIVGISAEPDDDGNAASNNDDEARPKTFAPPKQAPMPPPVFKLTNEAQRSALTVALAGKGIIKGAPHSLYEDVVKLMEDKPFTQAAIADAIARVTKK